MSPLVGRIRDYAPEAEPGDIADSILARIEALMTVVESLTELTALLNQVDDMRAGQLRVLRERVEQLEARL